MNSFIRKYLSIVLTLFSILNVLTIFESETVTAVTYDGEDLALAILANTSTLIDSSYDEKAPNSQEQSIILSELGTMSPTNGNTFILLSTGKAGTSIVTTDQENPGDERGTYTSNKYGYPRDFACLKIWLLVPKHMHSLYYDFQFFSSEYPEYVGSQYNDKFIVTVDSPSKGVSTFTCDVNNGNFILDSNYIPGTGFDIFAESGNPDNVDIVNTTPKISAADAGATAITTKGGSLHPVSPQEIITITFKISDTGDNQFDSAVFIDNLVFSGYARTDILATKEASDLNNPPYECNDTVKYEVVLTNVGDIVQNDNPGNEYEDVLSENITYVPGSAIATGGAISYNSSDRKIIWNGAIPQQESIILKYQVTINEELENGTIISNQGTVYWDSDENGTNDKTELTDDNNVDDSIDSDGDGETDDDDPTEITVISFAPPNQVIEDFSDDTPGENATQTYFGRTWFETNIENFGNNFEVVDNYHYSTDNGFKTQIRSTGGTQYWNYYLSELDNDINWWEAMFSCENASEAYDLTLTFKNVNDYTIAKLKFQYFHDGEYLPTDWTLRLFFWNPTTSQWVKLSSDYPDGALYKGWYKIRIVKNSTKLNYYLYEGSNTLVDFKEANQLSSSFSNLAKITFTSTIEPINCPLFIWDEHKLGLG
ncbi:MAG: hypothetical protein BV456_09385 [Thermoplasmata archaeon M8B2D]|nr:MAG: hypothetical protein BV456_09385 [Thermoplasmata archaeon M8B2D]